ncbi:MAG: nitrogen fixation protein [Gammaproteobacteria bacterium]|nr:nitrogen fixation protein [Gammaproteobacteria bacterium]
MRIGVTSQNFRTITGHAGKSRRYLVFTADGKGELVEVERFDLPLEMSIHAYHGEAHPVFGLDMVITGGCGEGYVRRLAAHGVQVVATSATDPVTAATAAFNGQPLPPAAPHEH